MEHWYIIRLDLTTNLPYSPLSSVGGMNALKYDYKLLGGFRSLGRQRPTTTLFLLYLRQCLSFLRR